MKHAKKVFVLELLSRNYTNVFACILGFIPGFLLPIFSPKFRNFIWCWLVPLAPIFFSWDGVISVFRAHSESEWKNLLHAHGVQGAKYFNWGSAHYITW